MSYAFTRDVPAGEGHYAEVRAAIGAAAPEGLVVHLVVRRDGGLRYIDIWDSEAHWRRFHDERIGPAVRTVMAARGMTRPATSPTYELMELIDAWVPASAPREPGRDAARAGSAPRLVGIHHLKVHVADVRRSALWYQRVLGYRPKPHPIATDRCRPSRLPQRSLQLRRNPMPSQTLQPDAGRPEPGERRPIPPTTCSAQEHDCGGNPVEAAALKRIAQTRAWQCWAELRGDLCEHRSATAALRRACDELRQARTIAPASQQRP